MTTQKAQSKIKTSTIAITILSVLLAVAVAATIVLAAFAANKQATTTISFANGVTIEVTGITQLQGKTGDTDNYWNYTATGTKNEGTATNVTSNAVLADITVKNTSSDAIYVIAKPVVSKTAPSTSDVTATYYTAAPSGWVALGNTGWYLFGTAASTASSVASQASTDAFTGFTITAESGASYSAVIDIYATNAADAAAGLADIHSHAGYSA